MVSIVIPTLGRDSLQDLIQSLPKSTAFEVIAVADRKLSASSFKALVHVFESQWPNVVLTQAPKAGVNSARNHGANKATHDVIWFLDDDVVVPHEDASKQVLVHFENHKLAAVGGGYLTPPEAEIDELGYNLLSSLWRHASGEESNEAFLGGCFAIRKAVFFEIGGFDESIQYGGAETQFVQQLRKWSKERNRLLLYEKQLDVLHRPRSRGIDEWAKLAFRQGVRAVATDDLRPSSQVRIARAKEFIGRLSKKEKVVLLSFCLPYLGITRVGRAASTLLRSKWNG